ncbi:hypothetical protein EDD21DRAFT_182003 [Dissophora ornata]|nr:hypothetical protein EDD21DRAFT_182003 [Dissophora ornata]
MRRPQIPLPNTNTKRQESERRTTHTETQTHAYTPLIHTLPVALCVILFFFPSSSERAALRVNEPLSFLITFLLPSYYLFLSTYSSSLSNRSRPVHSPQHWPKKPSFFENLGSDNNYSTMAPSNVDVDRHPVSPEPTAVSDSDSVAIEDQERSSKNKDLHQDRHQDKNPFAPPNRSSHSSDEHSTMERLHVVLEVCVDHPCLLLWI